MTAVATSGLDRAQRLADRAVARLLRVPLWAFLALVVVVTFARAGTWEMPNLPVQAALLRNPFQNPYGRDAVYLWWNWLSPCIAHFLGIRTVHSYYLFCLALGLAVLPAAYAAFRQSLPGIESRWRLLLLTCLPVAFIGLYWVGMDSLTLLLLLMIVRSVETPALAAGWGLLIGFQHAEQAGVAMVLYGVTRRLLSHDRRSVLGPLSAFVGVVVGRLLLVLIAAHASSPPSSGRLSYFSDHRSQIVESFWAYLAFSLFASFGVGWMIWLRSSLSRDEWKVIALVLVVGVGIGITAMDKTRVGAIVTLPAVMAMLSQPRLGIEVSRQRLTPVFGVAMIVPVIFVWQGLFTSVLPWDVLYLVHEVTGHPWIGSAFSVWPFSG